MYLARYTDLSMLRQALDTCGYNQSALVKTAKIREPGKPLDVQAISRRTQSPTPYNTLIKLFLLGLAIPTESIRSALTPETTDKLMEIGLLQETEEGIRSEAMLVPVEDLIIARDFNPEITGQPTAPDYVLGVGAASVTVANLTVRRPGKLALDLGTGSGIQGLLASQHAERVIATDTNARALSFAAFNAQLNGVTNIEFRQGSLYEPVKDCQFDLIVANPPFVISPQVQYAYRDSGMPGDSISEQVIRGAPALLREGGYCTVLCNWHHGKDQDWSERPRQWVTNNGCDAWVLHFSTEDPLSYAANWLRPTEGQDQTHYGKLLDEWLDYHQQMGIEAISSGAVILRRRSVPTNWVQAQRIPRGHPGRGHCGEQIQRIFASYDLLQQLEEENELLDYAFVLVPEHELEQRLQTRDGDWLVQSAQLKQTAGFEFTGEADRLMATVLAGCDGRRTLGELVNELACGLNTDRGIIIPPCLDVFRRLLQMGFLTSEQRLVSSSESRS